MRELTHLEDEFIKREVKKFEQELFPLIRQVGDCVMKWTKNKGTSSTMPTTIESDDVFAEIRHMESKWCFGDQEESSVYKPFILAALERLTKELLDKKQNHDSSNNHLAGRLRIPRIFHRLLYWPIGGHPEDTRMEG